jgi:hypothetical protein
MTIMAPVPRIAVHKPKSTNPNRQTHAGHHLGGLDITMQ